MLRANWPPCWQMAELRHLWCGFVLLFSCRNQSGTSKIKGPAQVCPPERTSSDTMFPCQWWLIPGSEVRSEPGVRLRAGLLLHVLWGEHQLCPWSRLGLVFAQVLQLSSQTIAQEAEVALCCDHRFVPKGTNCPSHTYLKFSSRFLHASQLAQHLFSFFLFLFFFPSCEKRCVSLFACARLTVVKI